jgi:hypothetical protein
MSQSQDDFWEGYRAALVIVGKEIDKVLAVCYNDRRIQNDLLDLQNRIKELSHESTESVIL